MKLTIQQKEYLKGLGLAQGIAERRSTMPVLSHTLLVTEGTETLLCRATDLYTTVTCRLEAQVNDGGGLAISAKNIFEIVKNLPHESISIQKLDSNHLEIRSGASRFRIVGLPASDYPEVPKEPETGFNKVPIAVITTLIGRTLFSVSQDDTRQHLSGVLVESKGEMVRMVSTDGHRLSKAEEKFQGGWPLAESILIPKKGVQEIKRMLEGLEGDCELAIHEGVLFVRSGSITLSVRLIDSRFPPYEKVIPASAEKKLVVDRVNLMDALKRVSLMSEDRNKGIRLKLESDKLSVETDTPELGDAHEDIEVDFDSGSLSIGFNATYLVDALSRIEGDEVFLEFNEELDPCVIKPVDSEDFLAVVMPLRL
ncbi:MAG: DNA polymerase III subunit beta [Polyangia bacterium]|jgi:DNA polymerase-3 subunit beta|nr:DNA polymerase III subunit beta [Polyangia bacterium]